MISPNAHLSAALSSRASRGLLRSLRVPPPAAADFASNDYLGLARLPHAPPPAPPGASGSRLLSGHSLAAARVEAAAAAFHSAAAALVFNSGYDANVGLFSCVPRARDVVVVDGGIHASVHDGVRLGRAGAVLSFAHNSVPALREKLREVQAGEEGVVVYVAVESVYSMDGDVAPLAEMLSVAEEMSTPAMEVVLIVDEAHGVGIAGPRGEGVAVAAGVAGHARLFARVVTYGKAFGAHGAAVLGSHVLREYLINYARPLIYSTALPEGSLRAIERAYAWMGTAEADTARRVVGERVRLFRRDAERRLPDRVLGRGEGPIQSVLVEGGNSRCVDVCERLRERGLDVYPIRSPTVPKGTERIRVVIHAHNSAAEVLSLVQELASVLGERSGERKRPALL